jgi:arginine deiminase
MSEREQLEIRLRAELDAARAEYVRMQADVRKALDTVVNMADEDRVFVMDKMIEASNTAFYRYRIAVKRFSAFALHQPIPEQRNPDTATDF